MGAGVAPTVALRGNACTFAAGLEADAACEEIEEEEGSLGRAKGIHEALAAALVFATAGAAAAAAEEEAVGWLLG